MKIPLPVPAPYQRSGQREFAVRVAERADPDLREDLRAPERRPVGVESERPEQRPKDLVALPTARQPPTGIGVDKNALALRKMRINRREQFVARPSATRPDRGPIAVADCRPILFHHVRLDGAAGLAEFRLQVGRPVRPMLASPT